MEPRSISYSDKPSYKVTLVFQQKVTGELRKQYGVDQLFQYGSFATVFVLHLVYCIEHTRAVLTWRGLYVSPFPLIQCYDRVVAVSRVSNLTSSAGWYEKLGNSLLTIFRQVLLKLLIGVAFAVLFI